jgi:hypothetical protein
MTFAFHLAVLRSHRRRLGFLLSFGVVLLATGSLSLLIVPVLSQENGREGRVLPITDPTALPRLRFEQLKYLGAFRLPREELNGDSFSAGGGPIAYNQLRSTLYVGSRSSMVAEVTVPTPLNTSNLEELPFAAVVQPFFDPSDGRMKEVGEGAGLAGLLVAGDRLYSTGLIYYDANNTQSASHFARGLKSNPPSGPPLRVWSRGKSGYVAGYMAAIPSEWQTRLGGTAITGQCCVPIISRTSWGPAAFAWTPGDLARGRDVDAIPLVYYDSDHQTLGPFEGSSETFGGTTIVNGVALISGTRTALFVGSNGTGPYCYGNGTADRDLHNTMGSDGARYCYDPATSDKGQHAYPYHYQMWAYDLNDWAQVRAGRRDPWQVRPYAVWKFELPFPEPATRIAGVAYDAAARRLFISQRQADRDGYAYRAVIHVYRTP